MIWNFIEWGLIRDVNEAISSSYSLFRKTSVWLSENLASLVMFERRLKKLWSCRKGPKFNWFCHENFPRLSNSISNVFGYSLEFSQSLIPLKAYRSNPPTSFSGPKKLPYQNSRRRKRKNWENSNLLFQNATQIFYLLKALFQHRIHIHLYSSWKSLNY